ncbi:MAG: sporulation initiation inhibitor Soj [Anaerolineae bacterium SM23_84]|nr:MAG: sporulation initiation inhibitor Soj [Anaerolineae bacterium SM23_84]
MTHVYAVANQKGGVGKTTTVVSVAAYIAAAQRRVLVVDIDPQANATTSLGVDRDTVRRSIYESIVGDMPMERALMLTQRLGLDLVPSTPALAGAEVELVGMIARERRLQKSLGSLRGRYEYILIDCPPSLGLLTINALTAADQVIIPVQCEYLPMEGLAQLLRTIELVRANLNSSLGIKGLLMTMYDVRTNLAQQVVDEVRSHFADKTFRTVIPRSVRLSEAPSYGEPIMDYAPRSPGAVAYQALAREIMNSD